KAQKGKSVDDPISPFVPFVAISLFKWRHFSGFFRSNTKKSVHHDRNSTRKAERPMGDFTKLAPYLQHPLVLVGFVVFLVIGTHRLLIKSKIIPQLSKRSGSLVVRSILRYGFVIALAVIGFGFGLQYFSVYRDMQGNKEFAQVLNRVYDAGDAG